MAGAYCHYILKPKPYAALNPSPRDAHTGSSSFPRGQLPTLPAQAQPLPTSYSRTLCPYSRSWAHARPFLRTDAHKRLHSCTHRHMHCASLFHVYARVHTHMPILTHSQLRMPCVSKKGALGERPPEASCVGGRPKCLHLRPRSPRPHLWMAEEEESFLCWEGVALQQASGTLEMGGRRLRQCAKEVKVTL